MECGGEDVFGHGVGRRRREVLEEDLEEVEVAGHPCGGWCSAAAAAIIKMSDFSLIDSLLWFWSLLGPSG